MKNKVVNLTSRDTSHIKALTANDLTIHMVHQPTRECVLSDISQTFSISATKNVEICLLKYFKNNFRIHFQDLYRKWLQKYRKWIFGF